MTDMTHLKLISCMYLYFFPVSLCLTAELCVCERVTVEPSRAAGKPLVCFHLFVCICLSGVLLQKPRAELRGVLVKGHSLTEMSSVFSRRNCPHRQ